MSALGRPAPSTPVGGAVTGRSPPTGTTHLGLVGTDLAGGQPRFTFGIPELRYGIDFVPLVMGIFGLVEIIRALETSGRPESIRGVRWPWPTRADLSAGWRPTLTDRRSPVLMR